METVKGQDRLAVREIQIEGDFLRGGKRMYHVGNRADAAECVKTVHGLRRVRHTDRDAVALAYPKRIKRGRCAVNAPQKGGKAGLAVHELVGAETRNTLCRLRHELVHRDARIIDGIRHIAIEFAPGRGRRDWHRHPSLRKNCTYYNKPKKKKKQAKSAFPQIRKIAEFLSEPKETLYFRQEMD